MANLILAQPVELYPEYLVGVVAISATNPDTDWPATNLIEYNPYEYFKTTAASTSTVITFDLGNQREFDTFALLHCNIDYQGTWQIETSTDGAAWTTRLAALSPFWCQLSAIPGSWSGEDNDPRRGWLGYSHGFYRHATVLTARYIRISVTNSTNADTYLTFGRLFVGKAYQPSINYAYGAEVVIIDKSEKTSMPRSAPLFMKLNKSIQFNITLEFASQTDMDEYLFELNYWSGTTEGILVCLDPETVSNRHKRILYGTFEEGLKITNTNFELFEQKYSITGLY